MATELTCSVCVGVAGEAHKCILCKKMVHMFCEKGKEDDERFAETIVLHVEEKRYKHFYYKDFLLYGFSQRNRLCFIFYRQPMFVPRLGSNFL